MKINSFLGKLFLTFVVVSLSLTIIVPSITITLFKDFFNELNWYLAILSIISIVLILFVAIWKKE